MECDDVLGLPHRQDAEDRDEVVFQIAVGSRDAGDAEGDALLGKHAVAGQSAWLAIVRLRQLVLRFQMTSGAPWCNRTPDATRRRDEWERENLYLRLYDHAPLLTPPHERPSPTSSRPLTLLKDKRDKHDHAYHIQGMRFVPLVATTTGRVNADCVRLMLVLAARQAEVIIANPTPGCRLFAAVWGVLCEHQGPSWSTLCACYDDAGSLLQHIQGFI